MTISVRVLDLATFTSVPDTKRPAATASEAITLATAYLTKYPIPAYQVRIFISKADSETEHLALDRFADASGVELENEFSAPDQA
jgi:hypothetical protein